MRAENILIVLIFGRIAFSGFMIDFDLNLSLLDVLIKKFFNLANQRMVSAFIDRAKEIY